MLARKAPKPRETFGVGRLCRIGDITERREPADANPEHMIANSIEKIAVSPAESFIAEAKKLDTRRRIGTQFHAPIWARETADELAYTIDVPQSRYASFLTDCRALCSYPA